ncbi:rRNA small subunit methyltransferase I [Liberibacter crescens BT-1]|uniref:Ribosomal RNA small subunit methyltransferase I n=1 Tax=Liberibacter crescens (strain BT-1) TaxID=1215343 RepID=L0EUN4_LIBCB|nr:16S rRNA (cytidine(1402)-2'-O)-methyltransferase [Liberibacter crescens]AGA64086.1 rRNA small subunit methyltransferase I [Liberibacter crescens BT-1]AMC12374.1 16S rRNA methyltransferase [Liberibacter crescens]
MEQKNINPDHKNLLQIDKNIDSKPLESGLYVISTPIGNLEDITIRALKVLSNVDIVACEDTRLTSILMDRYSIKAKLYTYNEHNSHKMAKYFLDALQEKASIALVSDSGTPLISDPGYHLVYLAIQKGYRIIPIPGPSAPLAALVASGLSNKSFFFAGFLPAKRKAKRDLLITLASIPSTLILFEAPHRLKETLKDCSEILGGERFATVCREMTKIYEEFQRHTLSNLELIYKEKTQIKGEIVLVVGPPDKQPNPLNEEEVDKLLYSLYQKMSKAKAASTAARITGMPRKQLYTRLLEKEIVNASS